MFSWEPNIKLDKQVPWVPSTLLGICDRNELKFDGYHLYPSVSFKSLIRETGSGYLLGIHDQNELKIVEYISFWITKYESFTLYFVYFARNGNTKFNLLIQSVHVLLVV